MEDQGKTPDPIDLLKVQLVSIKGGLDAFALKDQADDQRMSDFLKEQQRQAEQINALSDKIDKIPVLIDNMSKSQSLFMPYAQHVYDIGEINTTVMSLQKFFEDLQQKIVDVDSMHRSLSNSDEQDRSDLRNSHQELTKNVMGLQNVSNNIQTTLTTHSEQLAAFTKVFVGYQDAMDSVNASINGIRCKAENDQANHEDRYKEIEKEFSDFKSSVGFSFNNLSLAISKQLNDAINSLKGIPWADKLAELTNQMNDKNQSDESSKFRMDYFDKATDSMLRRMDRIENVVKSLQLK